MTLKEKFNALVPKEFGGMQEPLLTDCEKTADDYAIEFAEWIRQNYYDVGDSWCEWNSDKDTYSSKELLEIFKNEKAL